MRRWLLALGVIAIGAGLAAIVEPGSIRIERGDELLTGAGLLAILIGAHALYRSNDRCRSEMSVPLVERPVTVPVPGDEIDELLAFASPPRAFLSEGRRLRRRAHALAEDALTVLAGYSQTAATDALDSGDWTDDRVVAGYLGAEVDRHPITAFRSRLTRRRLVEHRFRRTLDAIEGYVPGVQPEAAQRRRIDPLRWLRAPTAGVDERPYARGETNHWGGVSAVAFVGIGAGIIGELAPLIVAGGVGLGYVAYARVGGFPDPELSFDRELSTNEPVADTQVDVTLTVSNVGDTWLADVRIVDGVPPAISVVSGTPRRAVALRPGASTTIRYAVEAKPGTHDWEPVTVIARSLNGTFEVEEEHAETTEMTCVPPQRPVQAEIALYAKGASSIGELPTDQSGEGIEFQSVRDYRSGDRMNRIDWRRFARTRDLVTVEFREVRATTVVVGIDARPEAYLAPDAEHRHAVQRGVDAADRLLVRLLESGHRVGLTTLDIDPLWLPPSADEATLYRARELLTTHPSLEQTPADGTFRPYSWVAWLRARIPGDAQLLLITPLCDDLIVDASIRMQAAGHPVTLVAPDPTVTDTLGRRLVALERRVRIAKLRRRGIRVIDWSPGEPLESGLVRSTGRWST